MQAKLSANLDVLRTVAVLLVLAHHLLRRAYFDHPWIVHLPPLGAFGVLIFFVHTCLVLMHSMQRGKLDGLPLFVDFYTRRVTRIYPLSVLAVLTAVALHLDSEVGGIPGLSRAAPVSVGRIVSNLMLVQNVVKPGSIINVLWSLPYEIQMYVFLPLLFMWTRRRRSALRDLCVLWTVSLLLAMGQRHLATLPDQWPLIYRLTFLQFVPNFLPGVIAFVLPRVPRLNSALWPPFIFILVSVFAIRPSQGMGWALCLIRGISIPLFAEIRSGWLRVACNRIAMYSYGIYLSHQFCIWIVFAPLASLPLWGKVLVLTGLLIGVPIVLYHGIEKPMIRAGARLAETWNPKPAMSDV